MLTDHTNVMVKKKDCQIRHLPLDKSHFITEMQDIRGLQLRAIIIFIIVLDLKHLQSLIFIRQVGYR